MMLPIRCRLLLLLLPLTLSLQPAWAQDLTLSALNDQLTCQGDIHGTFEQQRYLADLDTTIDGHGRYRFEADQRVHWHLLAPVDQNLVLDQAGIERNGAPVKDDPAGVARLILQVLQGDLDALKSRFDIAIDGTTDAWQAHLLPRQPALKQYLDRLELSGGDRVRHVQMAMHDGDRLSITLHPGADTRHE